MLEAGVIELCVSERAVSVVFAPKKDLTLIFFIDYRRLNTLTTRDSYPIPSMDECIDSLEYYNMFSTLDCKPGYWQIEVPPEDRHKSLFVIHHSLYQCVLVPFGLKNSPATIQRVLDMILASLKWHYAIVYLDDIIFFSRNFEDHLKHLRTVLILLRATCMSLKLKKFFFLKYRVDYLWHIVSPGSLSVADKTCEAIQNTEPPTTLT